MSLTIVEAREAADRLSEFDSVIDAPRRFYRVQQLP